MDGLNTEIQSSGRSRSSFGSDPVVSTSRRTGSTFGARRVVRLAEVGFDGRMRFEAVAHWLQDVAHDHFEQVGLTGVGGWVLRRLELEIDELPRFDQHLDLVTRCTESGSRCSDRVTTFTGCDGQALSARAVWVCVDPGTGRSCPLPPGFHDRFPLPAARRRLSTRLHHAPPPASSRRDRWPTRASDFDVYGHMNNAACCAPIDEVLTHVDRSRVERIEIEYRRPIQPAEALTTAVAPFPGGIGVWLLVDGDVRASARVSISETLVSRRS
jgi:acyl-ACP thioesterase